MDTRETLKKIIDRRVLVRETQSPIIGAGGGSVPWMFDFRIVLMEQEFLDLFCELFWTHYAHRAPFQVGGMESAALPLITAIVMSGKQRGLEVNGFYVRKSRKPIGLQKNIEGTLTDAPIILVDDLISSGSSFMRQLAVLNHDRKQVTDIFVLVQSNASYAFAKDASIKITSAFSLKDFGLSFPAREPPPDHAKFKVAWAGKLGKPNYFLRAPKSAPVIDKTHIYLGSDSGSLHAIRQDTGDEVWAFRMRGYPATPNKAILSTPALYQDLVYFGAYDGNFYAIDTTTGMQRWVYEDADSIGSSPAVAEDLGLVFIGLEYGLWKKQGGIVALDALSGAMRWLYRDIPSLTHGSPAYSQKHCMVLVGSNNGMLYGLDGKNGTLRWQFQSQGAIKGTPTFDEARGYVLFGSEDGKLYVLNLADGRLVFKLETRSAIYSNPLIHNNRAYVGSTDKRVYCLNFDTLKTEWVFATAGRIFASPIIAEEMLYIGSNDGKLYELDPLTGKNTAFFQTTERITNKIAYNQTTKKYFVPTYANELYCIEETRTQIPSDSAVHSTNPHTT